MAGSSAQRVLGVDPGGRATGYGVIRLAGARASLIEASTLRPPGGAPLPERLVWLRERLADVIHRHRPSCMVVETLFLGKNPRSAHQLAQVRGVVLLAGAEAGCVIREYTPAQIKKAATGSGRADKEQVRRMVQALLAMPEPPRSTDASDALAAALCHAAHRATVEALERLDAAGSR